MLENKLAQTWSQRWWMSIQHYLLCDMAPPLTADEAQAILLQGQLYSHRAALQHGNLNWFVHTSQAHSVAAATHEGACACHKKVQHVKLPPLCVCLK